MTLTKNHQPVREPYASRAPLADELLDILAEASRVVQRAGEMSERVRAIEGELLRARATKRGTPTRDRDAA